MAPGSAKVAPRWSKIAPRWASWAKMGQDRSEIAPRWPSAWPLLCLCFAFGWLLLLFCVAFASLLLCFCFAFAFAFVLLLCCLCFPNGGAPLSYRALMSLIKPYKALLEGLQTARSTTSLLLEAVIRSPGPPGLLSGSSWAPWQSIKQSRS